MRTTDTLKEYYVNLQSLYNNALNILTALNQSLRTSSSEVVVNITNSDDTVSLLRIPSFLYLENKLESLESNLENLIHMPESGEAWFNTASSMHKLELVKNSNAPLVPSISSNVSDMFVQYTDNNILKDMVLPKMFLRLNISNLPDNINDIQMKKIIIKSYDLYSGLTSNGDDFKSYTYIKEQLANMREGIDYVEYDSILRTPTKRNRFYSEFKIIDIPDLESGNPWIDLSSSITARNRYMVVLDTLVYYDNETTEYTHTLKIGDRICLRNENVIYKIVDISSAIQYTGMFQNNVVLEEEVGHVALQTYNENSAMTFEFYDYDYSDYHYVDVPLEEDPYVIIFLSAVYNNVRSNYSEGIIINLNDIYVKDIDGNVITKNGQPLDYISYYNEYCNNIGDLIAGLSETAYPQVSNFSADDLYTVTNGLNTKSAVNDTINIEEDIKVQRINSHVVDDDMTSNLRKLHEEKSNLNTQINNVQSNIDNIYNQLTTTDFSTTRNVSQLDLKNKLTEYYNERTLLISQKINIVNNIDVYKNSAKNLRDSKYRIRGVTQTDKLSAYLKSVTLNNKIDVIGIEIEYKYRSITSDTSKVANINSNIFTDWIRQPSIDKERFLEFGNGSYVVKYNDYNTLLNIIKWNQIDIPISQKEDVVIRIRYKLNVGQPFINIYTPWSDEFIKSFPQEFEENSDITTIMQTNDNDVISAIFNKTLINDGYTEHVSDKLIDNTKVFYHSADNIFSGFLTTTNTLMSLKDKFDIIDTELVKYKSEIDRLSGIKYRVYVIINGTTTELTENGEPTTITLYEPSPNEYFKRIDFNIAIYNEGDNELRLYPVFSGQNNSNPSSLFTFFKKYSNTIHGSSVRYFVDKLIFKNDRSSNAAYTTKVQTLGNIMAFTRYNINNGDLLNEYEVNNIFNDRDRLYVDNVIDGVDDIERKFKGTWTDDGLKIVQYETDEENIKDIMNTENTLLVYENIHYSIKDRNNTTKNKTMYLTHGTNLTKIIPSGDNEYEFDGIYTNLIHELSDLIGMTVTTKNGVKSIYDKNVEYVSVQTGKSELVDMILEYFLPSNILNKSSEDIPSELSVTTGFAIKTNPLASPSVYNFTIKVQRTAAQVQ